MEIMRQSTVSKHVNCDRYRPAGILRHKNKSQRDCIYVAAKSSQGQKSKGLCSELGYSLKMDVDFKVYPWGLATASAGPGHGVSHPKLSSCNVG